jgi:hypothetical protein
MVKFPNLKEHKVLRYVLIGCGGFLALVFVLVVITFFFANKGTEAPLNAAEMFVDKLSTGKSDAAYNLTSSEFQSTVNKNQFAQFLKAYPILTDKESLSFNYKSVKNDKAILSGTIIGNGKQKAPITVFLVKESGEWKIFAVSLKQSDVPTESSNTSN